MGRYAFLLAFLLVLGVSVSPVSAVMYITIPTANGVGSWENPWVMTKDLAYTAYQYQAGGRSIQTIEGMSIGEPVDWWSDPQVWQNFKLTGNYGQFYCYGWVNRYWADVESHTGDSWTTSGSLMVNRSDLAGAGTEGDPWYIPYNTYVRWRLAGTGGYSINEAVNITYNSGGSYGDYTTYRQFKLTGSPAWFRLNNATKFYLTTDSPIVAPVANFACDNVFANPGTDISCIDLSTNDPDSWQVHSYLNLSGDSYDDHHADYTESPWTLNFDDMGYWSVHLKACNSAGCDWENKSSYIRVGAFMNWTPSPTITQIPTMPWTNITTMNVTPLKYNISISRIGNLTAPLIEIIEGWFTQVLSLFSAVLSVFTYPITLLNGFLTGTGSIFTATFSQLLTYTTIPLMITGSVIGWMPWQIQALITLGILFDLIMLLLRGI